MDFHKFMRKEEADLNSKRLSLRNDLPLGSTLKGLPMGFWSTWLK